MNSQDIAWLKEKCTKTKMFSHLSEKETIQMIDNMERINFSKGDIIFEEGDHGDWFYIIREGKVDVIKKKWFKNILLKELGSGEIFGEFALHLNTTRSATLKAAEDTVCFVLYKNKFREQTEKHPEFKREIEKLIKKRTVMVP